MNFCGCRAEMLDVYGNFCKQYPIITVEDPFDQDDWDHWNQFTQEGLCQVCTLVASASFGGLQHGVPVLVSCNTVA